MMVYFVRKFRATSVPVLSRHEEKYDTPLVSEVRLYNPQRNADFVLNDVNELSSQSKKHDEQFVNDVNNIINHANTALYALPPATKSKRRHNSAKININENHVGSPLVVRRSCSHDLNDEYELDDVRTPATNSVFANHHYKILEKKVFAQPVVTTYSLPLFKESPSERRNSVCEVACRQAQNTIDRVNQELRHRSESISDYYHVPQSHVRRNFVRSMSLAPVHYNLERRERMMSRSPSPTLQTIVVANPKITERVIGHNYRSFSPISHQIGPVCRRYSVIGHQVDPVYRSYSPPGCYIDPVYRSYSPVGHHVDKIYKSSSPIVNYNWPVLNTHNLTGHCHLPANRSHNVAGYRVSPVYTTRSMSFGRLPTNHNEYAKMDTANFLSSAEAILNKPAIYSRNITSLPSIYSIGGSRPAESTKTYDYKSYSNMAAPLVNSVLNSGHVTSYTATPLVELNVGHATSSYQPISASPTITSQNHYLIGGERVKTPLSDVRRRVRGVLCKVKKDPNYFA